MALTCTCTEETSRFGHVNAWSVSEGCIPVFFTGSGVSAVCVMVAFPFFSCARVLGTSPLLSSNLQSGGGGLSGRVFSG